MAEAVITINGVNVKILTSSEDVTNIFKNKKFEDKYDGPFPFPGEDTSSSKHMVFEYADNTWIQYKKTGYKHIHFEDCETREFNYWFNQFNFEKIHEYFKRVCIVEVIPKGNKNKDIPSVVAPNKRTVLAKQPNTTSDRGILDTPVQVNNAAVKESYVSGYPSTNNGVVTILTNVDMLSGVVTTTTTINGVKTPAIATK